MIRSDVILCEDVKTTKFDEFCSMLWSVFELSAKLEIWYLIIDVRKTSIQNLELRRRLEEIAANAHGLKHVVLITEFSLVLRISGFFVIDKSIKIPFSIVKDLDSALERVEEVRSDKE